MEAYQAERRVIEYLIMNKYRNEETSWEVPAYVKKQFQDELQPSPRASKHVDNTTITTTTTTTTTPTNAGE